MINDNCKYCETIMDYVGELIKPVKKVGKDLDNLEIYIFNNPEQEGNVISINSCYMDIEIKIEFCPMCGNRIY